MSRPAGHVDVVDGRLIVHRPAGTKADWWDRVTRSLVPAGGVVEKDHLLVSAASASVLRSRLESGVAARSDWQWTPRATRAAEEAERVARSLRDLVSLTPMEQAQFADDLDLRALGFVRQLRPFQREAVARLLAAGGGADFSVPGSGKTTVAYAVWTAMRAAGEAHGLIVVAPPSAFSAWQEEAEACFAEGHVPDVRVRPDRLSNSDEVVVLNYERLSDAPTLAALRRWGRNRRVLVVFDEAHRAKAGLASRRGAAAAELAQAADASMVLTGTPMPNRESDLVAVFDLVWPGHGERLVDGDLARVRDRAFVRVTKDDLGLPPMNLQIERVALDPLHRDVYEAMRRSVGRWAKAAEVTAAEAGRALLRLIAAATNPAAVFDPGAPWSLADTGVPGADLSDLLADPTRHIRSAKIVRTAQIVAENRAAGRKTLVWSNFVDNVRLIGEALASHHPAVVVGATPIDDPAAPSDRKREIERFRNDSECWVLVATPQTLGEGVSLHRTCTDQVHVDRGYAAGTWLQSIDRTHRLGLPANAQVTCTVIEAEDTIDGRVAQVLNDKVASLANALNDRALRPVADPTIITGDPVAAVLGDIDALRELFAIQE
jgi:hypothetical protein